MNESSLEFEFYNSAIDKCLLANDWQSARENALCWAKNVASDLSLESYKPWKEFKINLAGYIFGKPESCFFSKCDSVENAINYCCSLKGKKLRYTIHKIDEACHSKSVSIDVNNLSKIIKDAFMQLDEGDTLKIFPESGGDNKICFRALMFFETKIIDFECGKGQACLVFENERGLHPICQLSFRENKVSFSGEESMKSLLNSLFENYCDYLYSNAYFLHKKYGIPYVSIEGYYDYINKIKPVIVDIDLPFDKAFFGGKKL